MSLRLTTFGFGALARRAVRASLLGFQMEALVRATALRLEGDVKRRIASYPIFKTGLYGRSWFTTPVAGGYMVATNVFYGPFQEYGTGDAGAALYQRILDEEPAVTFTAGWPGMWPRPHVRPAVAQAKKVLERSGRMLVARTLR